MLCRLPLTLLFLLIALLALVACGGGGNDVTLTLEPTKQDRIASDSHSLVIDDYGVLWAWGINHLGQIGDGTYERRFNPVRIMDDVVAVSAQSARSAAIRADGSLWSWGWGPVGDGSTENRNDPVKIMEQVVAVSVGHGFTMALRQDGSLWAWGSNFWGVFGREYPTESQVPIRIFDDVATVFAASTSAMAIKTDGSLWGWGEMHSIGHATREPVWLTDDAVTVAHTVRGVMALSKDGRLMTWGTFMTFAGRWDAEQAQSLYKVSDEVAAISSSFDFSVIVRKDGAMWGSGRNIVAFGGDEWRVSRGFEQTAEGIVAVSAGVSHTLALDKYGYVWMFGEDWIQPSGEGATPDLYRNTRARRFSLADMEAEEFYVLLVLDLASREGSTQVIGEDVYMLTGPIGISTTKIKKLTKGTHVEVIDSFTPPWWAKVRVDGVIGFVDFMAIDWDAEEPSADPVHSP